VDAINRRATIEKFGPVRVLHEANTLADLEGLLAPGR
jgi:hypothetical protein